MKKTYEFKGSNTSRTTHYYAEGESFKEVMMELIDKNVISNEAVDNYVMNMVGKSSEDYIVDEEYNQEAFDNDYASVFKEDADYYLCITSCDGNAYNQDWNIYDDENQYFVGSHGELHNYTDGWSISDYGSNIEVYNYDRDVTVYRVNHDDCVDFTYEENLESLLDDIRCDMELTSSEVAKIKDLTLVFFNLHSAKKFNQKKYIQEWQKENMASVSCRYNKGFVEEFKEACKKLNISQSQVIKKAMEDTINKTK